MQRRTMLREVYIYEALVGLSLGFVTGVYINPIYVSRKLSSVEAGLEHW